MKPIKISHSKSWIPWIRKGSSQLSQEIRGTSWHGGPLELLRVARAPVWNLRTASVGSAVGGGSVVQSQDHYNVGPSYPLENEHNLWILFWILTMLNGEINYMNVVITIGYWPEWRSLPCAM